MPSANSFAATLTASRPLHPHDSRMTSSVSKSSYEAEEGPSGKRASMYNGLADSIWVGSDNKPAAAKWPAMDDVLTGKKPPESLTEANNQVNQLFG